MHWCRRCHAFVDLEDPGDAYPQCAECGSRQVEYRSDPSASDKPAAAKTVAGFVRRVQTVSCAAATSTPITRVKKHLPAEKKNLLTLTKTGFWFCYADDCRQITEAVPGERVGELACFCCGAPLTKEVNWTPPAFKDEEEAA